MSDLLVIENLPTRDLVLRKLRGAILAGRFEPGQRLLERDLVERAGTTPGVHADCGRRGGFGAPLVNVDVRLMDDL